MISRKLAYNSPDECANLILDRMRVQESYKAMIAVSTAYLDEIEVLKRTAPVRVIHMRNLITYKKKLNAASG